MNDDKQTREEIKALGVKPPFWLKGEKLKECLDLVKQGKTQDDIDALYKPAEEPAKVTVNSPAKEEKPAKKEPTYTASEVERLIDAAISKALASGAAAQPAPQVVRIEKDVKKPMYASQSEIPEDDWADHQMRVFAPGNNFVMNHFKIKGRMVDLPYCQLLTFNKYDGGGTNRFGNAENLSYVQYVDISSKKMQDMFMQDDRMGSFFWLDTVEKISDREKFAMIVSRYSNGLQSQGQEELRQQCIALDIPVGNLNTMRNAIAVRMADKAMGVELGQSKAFAAEDRKDELFQKKSD